MVTASIVDHASIVAKKYTDHFLEKSVTSERTVAARKENNQIKKKSLV